MCTFHTHINTLAEYCNTFMREKKLAYYTNVRILMVKGTSKGENMSALKTYIDSKNLWSALFDGATISYPPSGDEIAYLFNALECDLSPENLACDGELRGAALARKARGLKSALKELRGYGPVPPDCYL